MTVRKAWEFITEPKHSNALLAIFTILIFISGVLYTVFAALQWSASRKSADAATSAAATAKATLDGSAQSFKQEQRAYLWASSFNMAAPPTCDYGGLRVCADVHIVNSGKTPANGVHLHRYATFGPGAEAVIKMMRVPEYKTPSGDMLGTTGDKWGTAFTEIVDPVTAKALVDGKTPLYIYGVVQYFDIFGEYHETGFCSQRVLNNTPFIACKDGLGNWFDKRLGSNENPTAVK
jgi:hypothetical protein